MRVLRNLLSRFEEQKAYNKPREVHLLETNNVRLQFSECRYTVTRQFVQFHKKVPDSDAEMSEDFRLMAKAAMKMHKRQECIPVGCVPSAAVAVSVGQSA